MSKTIINNSGHRQRLRERFAKSGFSGFHDYEVLEFLLTYIFRQGDVKPIAKKLIKEFGSFTKVLDAAPSELEKIEGMGKFSAISLSALRGALQYYFADSVKINKMQLSKMTDLVKFVSSQIANKKNEVFIAIYLNEKNEVLDVTEFSEGTVSQAAAYPRRIVEAALEYKATSIILSHNHPDGVAEPSDSDIQITDEIKKALQLVEVSLQEHIIIANKDYYSFRREGIL